MLSSSRWWFARRPHLALELTERLIRLSFYNATGEEEEGTELDENGVAIPKKKIESVHSTQTLLCVRSASKAGTWVCCAGLRRTAPTPRRRRRRQLRRRGRGPTGTCVHLASNRTIDQYSW